jgi:hypothetical protein
MRFAEDFADAARRHWCDAEALGSNRVAAADHHVGIAAECAIKHAIVISSAKGTLVGYQVHADKLWSQAATALDAARFPDLCATLDNNNPFKHWDISDRYANSVVLETDIETVDVGKKDSRRELRYLTTQIILRDAGLLP